MPEPHHAWYRHRPHPWHGLRAGENPPEAVDAFIELTPFDVTISGSNGREHALAVIRAAMADYEAEYGSSPPLPDGS